MPLHGSFRSMPFTDLLQWLGTSRKTGTLRVERHKVSKAIRFREGRLVGCSSDDPPERLGHFLLSRGLISETQLRTALDLQAQSKRFLGMILVEMGAFSPDDLARQLETKAEESLFSVFDWEDAVFRFDERLDDVPGLFALDLRVEEVLLRGLKRFDELNRIREAFHDKRIVLRHTSKSPPAKLLENPSGRKLYQAIDGERTIAEIVLHVHGSEYLVMKFVFELHRAGLVEIAGIKQGETSPAPSATAAVPTVEPAGSGAEPRAEPDGPEATPEGADPLSDWSPKIDLPARPEPLAEAAPPVVGAGGDGTGAADRSDVHLLARQLDAARRLMKETAYESALELLDHLYRQFPGHEALRRMTQEAEAAFAEKAYRHYLPPARVPIPVKPLAEIESESLSPTEFFLLSRMDGTSDIHSIIQVAPMREADALLTLKRMRESKLIELLDPETADRTA